MGTVVKHTFLLQVAWNPFPSIIPKEPSGCGTARVSLPLTLGSSRQVLLFAALDSGVGSSISQGVAFIKPLRLGAQTSMYPELV